MAEVLVQFQTVMTAPDGRRFVPSACGREDGHVWVGWLEFAPADGGGDALRTGRETVQPNRDHLMYWAQGLTQVFLEGALSRALGGTVRVEREVLVRPRFEGPAPSAVVEPLPAGARLRPRPVLDPFATFVQGRDVLLSELGALDTERLRDIALAYGFAEDGSAEAAGREELVSSIMRGVQRPAAGSELDAR